MVSVPRPGNFERGRAIVEVEAIEFVLAATEFAKRSHKIRALCCSKKREEKSPAARSSYRRRGKLARIRRKRGQDARSRPLVEHPDACYFVADANRRTRLGNLCPVRAEVFRHDALGRSPFADMFHEQLAGAVIVGERMP